MRNKEEYFCHMTKKMVELIKEIQSIEIEPETYNDIGSDFFVCEDTKPNRDLLEKVYQAAKNKQNVYFVYQSAANITEYFIGSEEEVVDRLILQKEKTLKIFGGKKNLKIKKNKK